MKFLDYQLTTGQILFNWVVVNYSWPKLFNVSATVTFEERLFGETSLDICATLPRSLSSKMRQPSSNFIFCLSEANFKKNGSNFVSKLYLSFSQLLSTLMDEENEFSTFFFETRWHPIYCIKKLSRHEINSGSGKPPRQLGIVFLRLGPNYNQASAGFSVKWL